MNRALAAAVCALMLCSCAKQYGHVPSEQECSGFGYAGNFFRDGAQAVFSIESERDMEVGMKIRCKCLFAHDASSCELVCGGRTVPVIIPETGKWCMVTVDVKLYEGLNLVTITGKGPMKSDVLIDYIEY